MARARTTKQSIRFNGEPLNLSELGRALQLSPSYLSRVFSGIRNPTIPNAMQIAGAVGMGLEEFIAALRAHRRRRTRALPKTLSA